MEGSEARQSQTTTHGVVLSLLVLCASDCPLLPWESLDGSETSNFLQVSCGLAYLVLLYRIIIGFTEPMLGSENMPADMGMT